MRYLAGRLGAVLLLGCSSNVPGVTKPTPPDLSSVIAGYAAPTAPLDAQSFKVLMPFTSWAAEIAAIVC